MPHDMQFREQNLISILTIGELTPTTTDISAHKGGTTRSRRRKTQREISPLIKMNWDMQVIQGKLRIY